MLGRLSFGTHTLRWRKGVMQISVIGHPLDTHFHDWGGRVIDFEMARGPCPGPTA